MSMRRMAGLLFAGGLAAGLGAGMAASAHASDPVRPAQGFPDGGPPVSGARLVQERCDQVPPWQQVRQSRDGTDPYFRLQTSGPGGPALCMAAGNLGDNDQTPLVAASCQGFGNAAEILELG
jgi:hypothetical protein